MSKQTIKGFAASFTNADTGIEYVVLIPKCGSRSDAIEKLESIGFRPDCPEQIERVVVFRAEDVK